MADSSRVELVTIGDELLLGFTIDTNAAYLGRALAPLGMEIVRHTTVGDAAPDIVAAVREALDRTGAVVTTGGLGPTSDDLTRSAIAQLFGRSLQLDTATFDRLVARWRARGLPEPLPGPNRQQAMVPDGARILVNDHGSAPGTWLEDATGRWVVMLPGVPRELRGMVADRLVPALAERWRARGIAAADQPVVRSRTLRTTGIPEATLADRIGMQVERVAGATLAYLPNPEGVDLRLTVRGMPAGDADRMLAAGIAELRATADEWVYGEETADLAAVVLDGCRARSWDIAVAESCTGGLLGARLTAIPGSSDVFRGGVIAYQDAIKVRLLGVCEADLRLVGAVSEAVALQLAAGVRERAVTTIGLAITGVAGPGGGTPEKPVGTVWIAMVGAGEPVTRRYAFTGDRNEIRFRATQATLDLVRRSLAG